MKLNYIELFNGVNGLVENYRFLNMFYYYKRFQLFYFKTSSPQHETAMLY